MQIVISAASINELSCRGNWYFSLSCFLTSQCVWNNRLPWQPVNLETEPLTPLEPRPGQISSEIQRHCWQPRGSKTVLKAEERGSQIHSVLQWSLQECGPWQWTVWWWASLVTNFFLSGATTSVQVPIDRMGLGMLHKFPIHHTLSARNSTTPLFRISYKMLNVWFLSWHQLCFQLFSCQIPKKNIIIVVI